MTPSSRSTASGRQGRSQCCADIHNGFWSRRLRVLIIAPSSVGIVGGQEVEAALLFRRWQDDPQIDARFISNNPAFPTSLKKLEAVRYLRTAVRLPIYLTSVRRGVSRVDLVHVFSASYSSFVMNCIPVWLISRLYRKKFVLNYHTAREWEKFASSKLARFVLKRTDRIVVPSSYLADKFRHIGFTASVAPNIIDEGRFKYRPRGRLRPIVICTRNLSPDYGIDVVIHAFAILQQHYPEAALYLVGDGPLQSSLRTLARTLRVSGVVFCGAIPNEMVPEWYERADIFVNASFLDSSPLSILEAMASGVPVVTTAAGGIPSIVKHQETALVCPVGDSQALAEQLMRLLREPQLALQLSNRAREQVAMYSWRLVRTKWLEEYGLNHASA